MKIVGHKNNLFTTLVGPSHSDKYPYGIPRDHLSGWANLSRKIISIKSDHYFHLGSFFQMAISLLV